MTADTPSTLHIAWRDNGGLATVPMFVQPGMGEEWVRRDQWQPIETAPKDDLIDIWLSEGRRWCDCYYDRICDEWRTSRPSGRLVSIKSQHVTHWMPRPTPPALTEGDTP
jgi:hypothetical protein